MDQAAAAAYIQTQLDRSNYINLVSFTILYYDYALTFSMEVERFWCTRSLSWASAFFYLNRYLVLFGHIPVMVQYYWDTQRSDSEKLPGRITTELNSITPFRCSALSLSHQYFAVAIQVIVGILLIMRTYALYGRKTWVLLCLCTCALAVIVYGAWSVISGHRSKGPSIFPKVGCVPPTNDFAAKRLATAWIGNLVFDFLIFSMTVYKSFGRDRRGRPLLNILIRDGAVYFAIMVIAGLANILSFYLSPEYERGFFTTFANIVSSTMMSRLMLNLRDPRLSAPHSEARLLTTLRFHHWSDTSDATTLRVVYNLYSLILVFFGGCLHTFLT
ncbi:hypothetical protein LshimejAT787_0804360 [Lyophyllum shimeji]|uniref:DUF6533 domain-containing protein n=1 Tax=Lyophyllum shimeji TaxID=47721 RepID=A0A9P3PRB1_LYOSH|nr:hypothetical protein LshimejAT787_0804360 [Lyophyllum shimeji]